MKRVEFRLSMPRVNSWNGKWAGEGKDYVIYKNLTDKRCEFLGLSLGAGAWWMHRFGDGWVAQINARLMGVGEKRKKSAGFCGYDWMVENIISYNETEKPIIKQQV